MDFVARPGWDPLQIHAFAQPGERTATSFVERFSFPHERLEAVGQKRADRPALFGRDDACFPKKIGVELQRYVCFHCDTKARESRAALFYVLIRN
jgi:hypothetical protein